MLDNLLNTKSAPCIWQYNIDADMWQTTCGKLFVVLDGTPDENDFKYCSYCGKDLIESEDDEE